MNKTIKRIMYLITAIIVGIINGFQVGLFVFIIGILDECATTLEEIRDLLKGID